MQENKIKCLEMIQGIIERMGHNSFSLKGWAATLIAVMAALAVQGIDKRLIMIVIVPAISFWCIDAYYLRLERKYKVLYKNMLEKNEDEITFDMDTKKCIYSDEDTKRVCFFRCLFSLTEVGFYLPLIAVVTFLYIGVL